MLPRRRLKNDFVLRRRRRLNRAPNLEALEGRCLPASWSTIANFASVGREWLAAVSGSDGRIYAIGGESQSGTTFTQIGEVDAYTISTNKWATASPLPDNAIELAAAEGGDGRIYALGGLDSSGNVLGTVYAYSPTTNKWTLLAPLPTPRFDMTAAEGADGRVYAIGGSTSKTALGSSVIEIYDPTTNTWSEGPPMPTARWGAAATSGQNGDIFVFGGANATSTALTTVEAFNPSTNSWTTLNPMPTAVYYLGTAKGADGRIYAVGGTATGTDHESITQIYAPTTNTWSAGPLLITGRSAQGVAAGTNGEIYAIGGIGSIGSATAAPLSTAEVLNVSSTTTPPVTPPAGGGGSSTGPNARYVERLYKDLLARAADPGGLAGFTQELDTGSASVPGVALAILSSPEHSADTVKQLYLEVLGRSVDQSGLGNWTAFLAQGHTSLELEAVLLGSSEFFQGRGQGTNAGFVQAVYKVVLGRQPDPAGEQTFVGDLNNGETTRAVAQQVLASSEAEAIDVQSLYESLLHRAADPTGLSSGIAILQNGGGLEGVTFDIVTSVEYQNNANANTVVLFVTQVYRDLLSRVPDPQGLSAFTGSLTSGTINRQQVALGIEVSAEYFADEVSALYQKVLHRAPDPGGMASAVTLLASGVTVTDLEAILLGSGEFYSRIGGGTNAGYASALYQVVLGRAVDPTGAQAISQALAQGTSRGAIALAVLHSSEGETDEVNALFNQFLHRVPDPGGLSSALALLNAGVTVEQLQAILIGSPEYLSLL
jgi:N-acetylneuraminic acid mutarotase